MVLGHLPLLCALGQLALTVVSDGQSSTCPDPELTQRLIDARMADSIAPRHNLHQEFVTDAQSGQSYVRLRLYNENDAMLLERLLPVEDDDCADVPLAVAIILENYFSDISPPVSSPAETDGPPRTPATAGEATPDPPTDQPVEPPATPPVEPQPLRGTIWGGLNMGAEAALSIELGFNYFFSSRGFLDLSVDTQLFRTRHTEGDYQIAHSIHSFYLGSGFVLPLSESAGLNVAPQIGAHYQRAILRGDNVQDAGTKGRIIASLGLKTLLSFDLSRRLLLGVGARVGAYLAGPHLIVTVPNEAPTELYPLPRFDWDGHLLVGYRF